MPGTSNSGRKKLPTKLKLLRGTLRSNRINPNEPEPKLVKIAVPPSLKFEKYAMQEWVRITRELIEINILTVVDYSMLEAYCHYWGQWREAIEVVEEEGRVTNLYRIAKDGNQYLTGIIPNPSVKIANDAFDRCFKAGTAFGITPSSRSKVNVPPKKKDDPFDNV